VNIGAENRNKLIASVVLMGVALILVAKMFWPSDAPAPVAAAPVSTITPIPARTTTTRTRTSKGRKVAIAPHSIDPSLRYDWLKSSEDTKYEGNGRNIFIAQAEIPKPIAPATPDAQKIAQAQGPPPPPPITLKFYGFASKPGEPKSIFLSQGEDVFIAKEGDIVDRRYKILHIAPNQVEVEDVLNNNRQNIPLTQG